MITKIIKLALLFLTTLTLFACGGGSSGGDPETPAGGGTPAPTKTDLSIADAQSDEGKNITFTVTSNPNIAKAISFDYKVNFANQTASESDLTGDITGSKTIATNDSNSTISIAIFDDNFKEDAETFQVVLSNLSTASADFTKNTAIGTIRENDPDGIVQSTIRISDATASEGGMLNFKVTIAPPIADEAVSFDYQVDFDDPIALNSATASDLTGDTSLRMSIAANSDNTTIEIRTVNDEYKESAENFKIRLSNVSTNKANITNRIATGTISASDPNQVKTRLRISDGNPTEANEGESIIFTVTNLHPITEPISFSYSVDFDNPQDLDTASTSDLSGNLTGTRTIAINDTTTATIEIRTVNDSLREKAEDFSVIFSDLTPADATFGIDNKKRGRILASDNDGAGIVTIGLVANAQASEDSGTINFKVTSKFPAISAFTFNYAVDLNNSSADADDFTATSGTATIPVDASSTTISIKIATDDTAEPDETFSLRLTPTSPNVILANNLATGTILNDDLGELSNVIEIARHASITLNWTNPNSNLFAGVTFAYRNEPKINPPADCSSTATEDVGNKTSHTFPTAFGIGSARICARSTAGSLSKGVPVTNLTTLLATATADNDGNGLIEIANITEFYNIRHNLDATSYRSKSGGTAINRGCPNGACNGYELVANMDLSDYSRTPTTWTPIGTFTAILEGNNKTISNLTINRAGESNIGLFSIVSGATIKNLKLATVSVTGAGNVGALIGDATNSTLSNIELIGDESQTEITGSGANVGGLVGSFSGTISDASSSLTVRGGANDDADNTGGLVGFFQSGSIKNSNSSGSVSSSGGADNVGGLVGQNQGNISNSWASGKIISNNDWSNGGLVGNNGGNISNSWASGIVSNTNIASNLIGGLAGRNDGNISNSWASGEVRGISNIGGLVGGNNGTISNNWASGEVVGTSTTRGGLVGQISRVGTIVGLNYRLSDGANNIGTKLATTDLAALSGATGDTETTHSDWHAGIGTAGSPNNLLSRYCDTNGNDKIDDGTVPAENPNSEIRNDNTVWVMAGGAPANNLPDAPTDTIGGRTQEYYRIPAIRCIANTAGITDQTTIDAMRKIEIDRQRRNFPTN